MKEFTKETMEKTIKNIRKKYKEIKSVEIVKNKLLGVQVKSQSSPVKSYAIQFTGEDANIYKIEKIAKINYKAFKIHRTKDRYGSLNCFFSLKGLSKSNVSCSYLIYIGDWVVFEESDDEKLNVKILYDRTFKQFYEESTSIF
jgi:hypothetical protein